MHHNISFVMKNKTLLSSIIVALAIICAECASAYLYTLPADNYTISLDISDNLSITPKEKTDYLMGLQTKDYSFDFGDSIVSVTTIEAGIAPFQSLFNASSLNQLYLMITDSSIKKTYTITDTLIDGRLGSVLRATLTNPANAKTMKLDIASYYIAPNAFCTIMASNNPRRFNETVKTIHISEIGIH
jgi:hypothetical protein